MCACVRACVRVCVCTRARAFLRECVSVSACVPINQCVSHSCIHQKRGPNSRLHLNLIPGHPFTMFFVSLYNDIKRKEALYLSNTFLGPLFVCGYPRGTWKGF